ncbi:IS21 family transposase [Candidatus Eisenbacteria bacterium]|uniref:IS21 family transposase n=1 Tax=Eiseniibacteriota bacterium TaxID=2212470 RepID=A0ABV6YLV9_UNCEI
MAVALGWDTAREPDEVLASRLLVAVRPGPKHEEPGETEGLLRPHRAQIESWLAGGGDQQRPLRLTKVHTLLRRRGVWVPYSSLHRFAKKHCGFGRQRATVRMVEPSPGELAEVDFGYLGLIPYPETGRRRKLWALIVTLCHSRHQYVHFTHSMKLADLIDGLEDAWEFFGGVTARVVLDNMRNAITRADHYDPTFQRTFAEYALHRGFVIDPAPVAMPTGKPKVERNVSYLRDNFFAGEDWRDRDHVQREAISWCLGTAGTRRHGTTQKPPLVVFEEIEKRVLKPLATARFDTPEWAGCTVHPDHHIQFRKALYSAPHRYLGRKVTVRGDRALVRIYRRGELIKTHPTQSPGGRSTDYNDYPQEQTAYALRDPQRLIRQACARGVSIGSFTRQLLSGTFPWAKLRQAQKLMRLTDKYGAQRVDRACRRALAFDLINVRRLERIIHHGLEDEATSSAVEQKVLPLEAKFLRPADSFTHHPHKEEDHHGDQDVTEDRPEEAAPLGGDDHVARSHGLRSQDKARTPGRPGVDPAG